MGIVRSLIHTHIGLVLLAIASAGISARGAGAVYIIDTVAGSHAVGDGGPASAAILLQAEGVATDYNGNVYIADAADHRVRKISPDGTVTTIAGTGTRGFSGDGGVASVAQLDSPYGIAFDGRASLYIADLGNARVRRVGPDGTITTVAGGGSLPAGGANEGSPGTVVALTTPRNLAFDASGNLYISDFTGQCVYRLSAAGFLTTAAGTGVRGFSIGGTPAPLANLSYPTALAVDRQGALYIADSQNHVVRKVVNGVISTFAHAYAPTGLAFDGLDTLYVADSGAGEILVFPKSGSQESIPVEARDLSFGPDGSLYATDGTLLRRVSPTGSAALMADAASPAWGDGGFAKDARLSRPSGVAADSLGNVYLADRDHHRIRRVALNGTIATVAGSGTAGYSGDGGPATEALLNAPSAVSIDASGNLYIADAGNNRVRKVTLDGTITTIAGRGDAGFSGDFGAAVKAQLDAPGYAIADAGGNLWIADTGNGRIRKVDATTHVITTMLSGLQGPRGLAFDGVGNLYFTEQDGPHVRRLSPAGDVMSLGEGMWNVPRGVAVNANGEVFVADTGLQQILRLDSPGQAAVVAGSGIAGFSGDGGDALFAELGFPWDVAADPTGILYIADFDNDRIRRLTPQAPALAAPATTFAILNAASLQAGPIAPGMLVALRGAGVKAADTPLVFFNGLAAPILQSSDVQLVVETPVEIATLSSVTIEIVVAGSLLAQTTVPVVDSAPALFADSTGQAAAVNEDGTSNSASNPLPLGSVISLYGTGLGIKDLPVSATVGGVPAEILYSGIAPGNAGLFQVNARVPGKYLAPGSLAVVVTVGVAPTQTGVTISTKDQ